MRAFPVPIPSTLSMYFLPDQYPRSYNYNIILPCMTQKSGTIVNSRCPVVSLIQGTRLPVPQYWDVSRHRHHPCPSTQSLSNSSDSFPVHTLPSNLLESKAGAMSTHWAGAMSRDPFTGLEPVPCPCTIIQ